MSGRKVEVSFRGMDTTLRPAKDTALLLREVELDGDGAWRAMSGTHRVDLLGSSAILAVYWFQPRPNMRWLVAERRLDAERTEIVYVDWMFSGPGRGTAQVIATRRNLDSAPGGTVFAELGRWLFMLSPVDGLTRWDGYRSVRPVGFSGPAPAPRVAGPDQGFTHYDRCTGNYPATFNYIDRQRGLGPFPTSAALHWKHGYALTIINELGQESPPSPVVWATGENATTTGYQLARISIPRMPSYIRGIRLWRTLNLHGIEAPGLVDLHLCAEWNAGAGPIDYLDHKPDAELGPGKLDRDNLGPVPSGVSTIAFWQSRCWLAGSADYPGRLFYSAALFPEQFPAINYLDVGSSRAGRIVAIRPMGRALLVWKEGGVYVVKVDSSGRFRVETVTETEGCDAPQAIEVVPELGGVLYLNRNGPRLLRGSLDDDEPTRVLPIVSPILRYWRRKVGPNLAAARSVFDPVRMEVWFAVPESGDPNTKNGVVLHIPSGVWSVREGWGIGAMTHHRGRTYLGAMTGGVWVVTQASRTRFGGTAIEATLHTNRVVLGEPAALEHVDIRALALGATFTVSTKTDELLLKAQGTRPQTHGRQEPPRWGTATWSTTELWADYDLVEMPTSVHTESGIFHEVRVTMPRGRLLDLALRFTETKGPRAPERR